VRLLDLLETIGEEVLIELCCDVNWKAREPCKNRYV
jgi:hypothetical protein